MFIVVLILQVKWPKHPAGRMDGELKRNHRHNDYKMAFPKAPFPSQLFPAGEKMGKERMGKEKWVKLSKKARK